MNSRDARYAYFIGLMDAIDGIHHQKGDMYGFNPVRERRVLSFDCKQPKLMKLILMCLAHHLV
jgi:hypothetical protein